MQSAASFHSPPSARSAPCKHSMLTAHEDSVPEFQPSQLQSTGPDPGHRAEQQGKQLSLKRCSEPGAQISLLDHAPPHSHVFVRDATNMDLGRICWPQPSRCCTAQPPGHCHSPQCSYPGNSPPPMGNCLLGHRARFTGWQQELHCVSDNSIGLHEALPALPAPKSLQLPRQTLPTSQAQPRLPRKGRAMSQAHSHRCREDATVVCTQHRTSTTW